jgi:hypothetical protein
VKVESSIVFTFYIVAFQFSISIYASLDFQYYIGLRGVSVVWGKCGRRPFKTVTKKIDPTFVLEIEVEITFDLLPKFEIRTLTTRVAVQVKRDEVKRNYFLNCEQSSSICCHYVTT